MFIFTIGGRNFGYIRHNDELERLICNVGESNRRFLEPASGRRDGTVLCKSRSQTFSALSRLCSEIVIPWPNIFLIISLALVWSASGTLDCQLDNTIRVEHVSIGLVFHKQRLKKKVLLLAFLYNSWVNLNIHISVEKKCFNGIGLHKLLHRGMFKST